MGISLCGIEIKMDCLMVTIVANSSFFLSVQSLLHLIVSLFVCLSLYIDEREVHLLGVMV